MKRSKYGMGIRNRKEAPRCVNATANGNLYLIQKIVMLLKLISDVLCAKKMLRPHRNNESFIEAPIP